MLGQAYGQVRYKDYALLTGGRQLVDEGIPNAFEAITVTGKLGPVGYDVGYIWI